MKVAVARIYALCFALVARHVFSHACSVSRVPAVEVATDTNQLSRGESTEGDMLATTGDEAAAASIQTCAVGFMCASAP
jgi:hypothetical protein